MNAVTLVREELDTHLVSDSFSLDTGAGTSLFVSGSAPTGTDMMAGEGVEMFMQSVLETGAHMDDGDQTGLYMQSV